MKTIGRRKLSLKKTTLNTLTPRLMAHAQGAGTMVYAKGPIMAGPMYRMLPYPTQETVWPGCTIPA